MRYLIGILVCKLIGYIKIKYSFSQALLNFTNLLSFDFFLDGDIFVFKPLSSKLESDIISLFITQLLKLFV